LYWASSPSQPFPSPPIETPVFQQFSINWFTPLVHHLPSLSCFWGYEVVVLCFRWFFFFFPPLGKTRRSAPLFTVGFCSFFLADFSPPTQRLISVAWPHLASRGPWGLPHFPSTQSLYQGPIHEIFLLRSFFCSLLPLFHRSSFTCVPLVLFQVWGFPIVETD